MLIYSEGFKEGYNTIVDLNKYPNVKMDVGILKLQKGSAFELYEENKELAALLLTGELVFETCGKTVEAKRDNIFDEMPYCVHIPQKTKLNVKAVNDCEIYIQKAVNDRMFDPVIYAPKDIQNVRAGDDDVLNGCMRRNIRTVFDYDNAPYSNMVLGEVINFPGKWSSYPPHYHPQPEVYFYKFDREQGFGASFMGDNVYRIEHNSTAVICDGVVHPQVTAPGYALFYVWGIAHLEGDPWIKTRINAKEHEWLLAPDAAIWDEK